MDKRRKLTGAGVASIAVMATLAGVPAASASSTCVECNPGGHAVPPAFLKLAEKLQAETTGIFLKIETAFSRDKFPNEIGGVFQKITFGSDFLKLGRFKFPGGPGDVFKKIT